MDGIRLQNKGRTNPRFVQKLVPWKPGEIYKPDHVAELERRLLETQVYNSATVALAPAPDADGLRPVVVSLADRAQRTFDFSAGYSTTEGVDANIAYSFYNLLGRADTVSLQALAGQIENRIGPVLTLPDFGHPGQTLTAATDGFRTIAPAYTETGGEIRADLTQRYGKTSFLTRGISLSDSSIDDKELGTINVVAVRFYGVLSLDRTDNTLDPHQGWKVELRAQPTAITGDETLAYLKLVGQYSRYFALDKSQDTVVAARVRLGSILGGDIPRVPASDRFFAGGGGSVRGYGYQDVGPYYSDNTPKGGLALFESTIELRHRFSGILGGKFGGVLFVDTGSVNTEITPQFIHTATGVGFGFRYDLGFAPIRADIAFPVNRLSGASQAPFQVYISVGQSF
jgi:translocation and assembly module TamA